MKNVEAKKRKSKPKLSPTECKICGLVIRYSYLLSEHMKRRHLKQKDFKCSFCPSYFVHAYEVKRHSSIHTGEKPYACSVCNKSYRDRNARNWHEDKHKVIKHNCRLCKKVFYDRQERRVHEKMIHTSEIIGKLQCVECRKKFSSKNFLESHMQEHNINIKCSYCPLMFSKDFDCKLHEKEHIREIDSKNPSLFENKQHRDRCMHRQRKPKIFYRPKLNTENGSYFYRCHICTDSFILKKELFEHYDQAHPGEKDLLFSYSCDKCEKKFKTFQLLKQHKAVHATDKPIKCTSCNYRTARRRDLQLHVINHHSLPSFECKYCGKRFRQKCILQAHLNKHENKKIFKCDVCDESFFSQPSLRKHKFKHAEHCICSICGMHCTKSKLSYHLAKHKKDAIIGRSKIKSEVEKQVGEFFQECSDILPYENYESSECKLCTKKLINRSAFLKHLNAHGEDELTYQTVSSAFECCVCGLIFASFRELECHNANHDTQMFINFLSKKQFWWVGSNFKSFPVNT